MIWLPHHLRLQAPIMAAAGGCSAGGSGFGRDTAPAIAYTTFDPTAKGANVTLSNGNLTATNSGAGCVRTVKAIGAAEFKYWVCTVGAVTSNSVVGGSNSSLATSSYPGQTVDGLGWFPTGVVLLNNFTQASIASYTTGDVLGFAINRLTGAAYLYKNGTLQTTITSALYTAAMVYPTAGAAGGACAFTFNFGPTMPYSPPGGASLITA